MHALNDFLTTDYGLMSAVVIVLVIAMGAWIGRYVSRQIDIDTAAHERKTGH